MICVTEYNMHSGSQGEVVYMIQTHISPPEQLCKLATCVKAASQPVRLSQFRHNRAPDFLWLPKLTMQL